MAYVTKPEAFSISEIKSTIMDRLHMGGSFLQQSQSVTVGGLPVAIRQGGSLGSLGGALSSVTATVQAAGDIAALVENPMALVEGAVGSAISGVSGQISEVAGKLTGGQLSTLTSAVGNINTALNDFQAHTSNLSGLSTSIVDTIPDFNKIKDLGDNVAALGGDTGDGFVANNASALFSEQKLTDIQETISITVANKIEQIKTLDETTLEGQTAIAVLVSDVSNLLNNQKDTIEVIVTSDTNNFNESSNNLTASTSVIGLAEKLTDPNSVSNKIFRRVGKKRTLVEFDNAIQSSIQA